MKIGLLTACYHPVINGVTRMVMLTAQTLHAMGHEPTIFALGPAHPQDEPYVVRSPGRIMGDSGYYFATRYTAVARTKLAKMDILHAHHLWMSLDFAHRYAQNQPVIYTNHTRYDIYAGEYLPLLPAGLAHQLGKRLMHWMWPRQTKRCAAVISPSAHVKQIMEAYGVRAPITVIPNGIERKTLLSHPSQTDLNIPSEKITAIYVGRLASEKRILFLLDRFAQACQTTPQLHLLLLGDGLQRQEVTARIAQPDLQPHVTDYGWIPYDQIGRYLTAADFFITASLSEVHPLTVLEAMTAGLPIAAPPADWVRDCVPDSAGLFTTDLADNIAKLAQDHTLRQQMGHAAQEASIPFDIENTTQQTITLYQHVSSQ